MKTQKITVKILVAVLMIAMLLPCIAACSSGETAPEDFEQIWDNETSNNDSNNNGNQNSNQNNGQNNNQNNGQNDGQNTANTNNPNKGEEPEEEKYEISSIGEFHDGLAKIETSIGYGYIDTKGNVVINPEYTSAENFKNGLACVGKGGKYGYIDTKGNVVIKIVYDSASEYFEDIAIVVKDGVKQYINAEGTVLYTVTGKESAVGEVSNGYFWIETVEELLSGNQYTLTYYNKTEKAFSVENAQGVTSNKYSNFNQYGYAFIYISGDIKLIYTTGSVLSGVFDLDETGQYKSFTTDRNGDSYYRIAKSSSSSGGVWVYIDFENALCWLAQATNKLGLYYIGNNYYILDKNLILQDEAILVLDDIPEFEGASIWSVAYCQYNGKDCFWVNLRNLDFVNFYSLIDVEGNVLIKPNKEYQTMFKEWSNNYTGFEFYADLCKAKSTETGLYGYIGLDGEWVIQPKYESATDFYGEGDDAVAVVNNNTIINRKGEIVFTIAE